MKLKCHSWSKYRWPAANSDLQCCNKIWIRMYKQCLWQNSSTKSAWMQPDRLLCTNSEYELSQVPEGVELGSKGDSWHFIMSTCTRLWCWCCSITWILGGIKVLCLISPLHLLNNNKPIWKEISRNSISARQSNRHRLVTVRISLFWAILKKKLLSMHC